MSKFKIFESLTTKKNFGCCKPDSINDIVLAETPAISANFSCDKSFLILSSLIVFPSFFKSSFINSS